MAPGATTMVFSPAPSTTISAIPVAAPSRCDDGRVEALGAQRRAQVGAEPVGAEGRDSTVSAPSRRAATAWLAPLPPGRSRRRSRARSRPAGAGAARRPRGRGWRCRRRPLSAALRRRLRRPRPAVLSAVAAGWVGAAAGAAWASGTGRTSVRAVGPGRRPAAGGRRRRGRGAANGCAIVVSAGVVYAAPRCRRRTRPRRRRGSAARPRRSRAGRRRPARRWRRRWRPAAPAASISRAAP